MFEGLLELFDKYKVAVCPDYLVGRKYSQEEMQLINDLFVEINRRFLYIEYALSEIDRIERERVESIILYGNTGLLKGEKILKGEWTILDEKLDNEQWVKLRTLECQIIYHLEGFYHQAHRCIKCIVKLPMLETLGNKFIGVMQVRNKLIEHPLDKKFVSSSFSFTLGGPEGPIYKSIRQEYESKEFLDQGLYKNRVEFISELRGVLIKVIEEHKANKRD